MHCKIVVIHIVMRGSYLAGRTLREIVWCIYIYSYICMWGCRGWNKLTHDSVRQSRLYLTKHRTVCFVYFVYDGLVHIRQLQVVTCWQHLESNFSIITIIALCYAIQTNLVDTLGNQGIRQNNLKSTKVIAIAALDTKETINKEKTKMLRYAKW